MVIKTNTKEVTRGKGYPEYYVLEEDEKLMAVKIIS